MTRTLAVVLLLSLSLAAQATVMTNDDVVKMVKAGVGDTLVLQQIDRSQPAFDTSVDGVIALKRAGVSDTVINRIMSARAPATVVSSAPAPGYAPPPPGYGQTPAPGYGQPAAGGYGQPASPGYAPPPAPPPAASSAMVCRECGVVELVREVEKGGQAGGAGAALGGVTGAVVGRGVSNDRNRTFGTIAGAVGGAVAGHMIEKNVSSSKAWEVVVRHEDGAVRTYPQQQAPSWRQGDRVRVVGGVVGPL